MHLNYSDFHLKYEKHGTTKYQSGISLVKSITKISHMTSASELTFTIEQDSVNTTA